MYVTIESKIGLGWWELKAAVSTRSMQLTALRGFLGSLVEMKEGHFHSNFHQEAS